jgi:uncharacterized protein YndB with AHSA1/START domain/mannose-6-phosphate isomerase-like protein (cupin superfamily)
MAKSGDVLEVPELGFRITFLRTSAETGGEVLEYEVTGKNRGFLRQEHVHPDQTERFEPLAGSMKVVVGGAEHRLEPGDVYEVPPGTPHKQLSIGDHGSVRVSIRPARRTEQLIERLAAMSREGRILGSGWPRPTAAAELVRDFGDDGGASRPPIAVQRAISSGILASASAGRALRDKAARAADNEYLFVDEWDVAAPPQAVFDALADARTYPRWWTPVYIDVDADGPPVLGKESRQHFKGRLPYHLHTRSKITRLEPPHVVQGDVEGDLRGRGTWTLTPTADGTHVRFDWRVFADRRLLRALTPVLRPVFRWNHTWAIARAMEGLEPYARGTAQAASAETVAIRALPDDAVPST